MPSVGGYHWCHLAFLFHTPQVGAALARILPYRQKTVEIVSVERLGCATKFDRELLCIHVNRVSPGDDLLAEISKIEFEPFEAMVRGDQETRRTRTFGLLNDDESIADERLRVQCLAWLSKQVNERIGYWHHEGHDGLIGEYFLGFGDEPKSMLNEHEHRGMGWPASEPRGAWTAAMWYIGLNVPNLDECASLSYHYGERLLILPRDAITERVVHRNAWMTEDRPVRQLPKLPDWLQSNQERKPAALKAWWNLWR